MKLIVGLAALMLVGNAGCYNLNEPEWLRVDVATSGTKLKVGENIGVTVTVTNKSDRPQTINALGCPKPFVVKNIAGESVGPEGQVCVAILIQKTLQPGEVYVFTSSWNGRAFSNDPNEMKFLNAGVYTLRGHPLPNAKLNSVAVEVIQ